MSLIINKYWKVKPDNLGCGVISLRDDLSLWAKFRIRWLQPITVLEFHRAVQAWLSQRNDGLHFENATNRGDFKISPNLEKKVDRVFQLQNSWTIHSNSLKVLSRGPLLNVDGTAILVPAHGSFASIINWLDESPLRKIIGFFLPLILLALKIFGII